MTVIVYLTHRTNISRLLAGEESRIGNKGKP
jgi:glycerol-3-phosphate acyltransferase PlsY